MWLSAFALAVSILGIVYLSRDSDAPWPSKKLVIVVLLIVALRAGIYAAFRLFDERDVFLGMGILLLVVVLVGIVFSGRAVWKQMGSRDQ